MAALQQSLALSPSQSLGIPGSRQDEASLQNSSLPRSDTGQGRRYQPLDMDRDQIRILRLFRGSWAETIHCSTFTAYLEDEPVYTALSYVWGDANMTQPIYLNGHLTFITINLFAALRRLRRRDEDIELWADTVCINQINPAEKAHQVQLMGKVYSHATRGLMWLGEYHEDDLPATEHASPNVTQNIRQTIRRENAVHAFNFLERLANDAHFDVNVNADPVPTQGKSLDVAVSLTTLMALPWWHRIWTVQEAVLPPEVILQCGSVQLSLEDFDKAVTNFFKHRENKCCPIDKAIDMGLLELHLRLNPIFILRENREAWGTLVFAMVLLNTRLASEEQDKVYALLGLFPANFPPINVDYSLTCGEVFANIMAELIRFSGDLLPLARTSRMCHDSSFPSWAAEWFHPHNEIPIGAGAVEVASYENHNAAGGKRAVIQTFPPTTLSLLGQLVDSIAHIQDLGGVKAEIAILRSLKDRALDSVVSSYPGGGSYEEAFQGVVKTGCKMLSLSRFFFITRQGFVGVSKADIEIGDGIYILYGGKVPFILRHSCEESSLGQSCIYVGHSYIHGIMNGEALKEDSEEQWISLI